MTLSFTVPLVPPSVNHYVRHTRSGRHYVTKEGIAFKQAVGIFSRSKSLYEGKSKYQLSKLSYSLSVKVFFAAGQKGDGDNLWKCIADGLKEAGVIHSDAAVKIWHLELGRDAGNPRTEITVAITEA